MICEEQKSRSVPPASPSASHSWRRVRHGLRALLPTPIRRWLVSVARIRSAYRMKFGRNPALLRPRRYSEKMQWRKLFDVEPVFVIFSDKLACRHFIATKVGADLLAPLLWSGEDAADIPFSQLQPPYVVKSSHASGHVIMVADQSALDEHAIRATARGWLDHCQATAWVEPAYAPVPRRIMVERMVLTRAGSRATERRFFVFDGCVRLIQTNAIRADGAQEHGAFHTPAWERMPWRLLSAWHPGPFDRPVLLDRMIALAECLAAGQAHLRVDIYDCGDSIRIGELTVYSWSGLVPFTPPEADLIVGRFWTIHQPATRAFRSVAMRRAALF